MMMMMMMKIMMMMMMKIMMMMMLMMMTMMMMMVMMMLIMMIFCFLPIGHKFFYKHFSAFKHLCLKTVALNVTFDICALIPDSFYRE